MKLKKLILSLTFLLAVITNCSSQCQTINLIENPSLEDYTCCPTNTSMIDCANYWSQPFPISLNSTDYFNSCGIDSLDYPPLLPMFQHAFFGNGYAGFWCDTYTNPSYYREYLQGILNEPLDTNKCYYVEFWTLLSGFNSTHAFDAIGVYFSDTIIKGIDENHPLFYHPQINNSTGRIINDTINWTKISGYFIANGGEKYFTIGTFIQENIINWSEIKPHIPGGYTTYYFFDNFSLCPCNDTTHSIDTLPNDNLPIYIPNIFSPNGNYQNDKFYIRGENIKSIHLVIYNRWGNKIFETSDINEGWDGTFKGIKCEQDVYIYNADITINNDKKIERKGNVTLVR